MAPRDRPEGAPARPELLRAQGPWGGVGLAHRSQPIEMTLRAGQTQIPAWCLPPPFTGGAGQYQRLW